MLYNKIMMLLSKYEGCIDCEVFIEENNESLVIVSQGIKIDEIFINKE